MIRNSYTNVSSSYSEKDEKKIKGHTCNTLIYFFFHTSMYYLYKYFFNDIRVSVTRMTHTSKI